MRRRFINNHKTFDYSKYMTIEVLEDGYEVYFNRDVEYNLNGHKWVLLKAGLTSPILKKGDLLSLRCSLTPSEIFGRFNSNGKAINLRGNSLSLIFKDDVNLDISNYPSVFSDTFSFLRGNNIVGVEKNFLPATTLANYCYYNMFYGCTSLVNAPELPATTLANYCYSNMFYGCTSLTTAPELLATILASGCYSKMFGDCKKLNYIKMLATDISASDCLSYWVSGVASSGTFVKNPAMTSLPTATQFNDYAGIPSGWTVVNDGEESGGKIVNTIVLRPYVYYGKPFNYLGIKYEISYPITSEIEVTFYTNGFNQKNTIYFFDYSGQNGTFTDIDMNPESAEIQVISINPQEDDTYIYDVVIEY